MSSVRKKFSVCDDESEGTSSCGNQGSKENSGHLDHEIAQLTKLRSIPHALLGRDMPGKLKLPVSTVKMLVGREGNYSGRGRFSSADSCHVLSRYLPVSGPWNVDKMKSPAYVSQFSADGTLLIAGFQRGQIRIYNVEKGWQLQKNILARGVGWTITDTCLSPDQRYLVYSSMSPIVHIVTVGSAVTDSLANITEIHDGLDFTGHDDDDDDFGIFSLKFSTDGRELVAASSDNSIYVYDLEANRRSLRIPAHKDDVNTVCFADETGHLIYSGSDDNLCKIACSRLDHHFYFVGFEPTIDVWDRRCFITKGQAAGVLMGHLEGITFLDSRGDGRYFISNGKDQTTKLWDIRRMGYNTAYNTRLRDFEWDYRWMEYPPHARTLKHPRDQSLATYKGHSVLRTLIRCHFSPEYSTGQRYIYTGSSDASVYIYDLVTGAEVARLDFHDDPVRDCNWHPYYPILVSSSWDGVIARWEFPGCGEASVPVRHR